MDLYNYYWYLGTNLIVIKSTYWYFTNPVDIKPNVTLVPGTFHCLHEVDITLNKHLPINLNYYGPKDNITCSTQRWILLFVSYLASFWFYFTVSSHNQKTMALAPVKCFFPKRFKVFCLSKFQLSDPLEDKWSVLNWRKWLLFRRHRDKWERKKKREWEWK